MGGFVVRPTEMYSVANTVGYVSDLTAQAGIALAALEELLAPVATGLSLRGILERFSMAWYDVGVDLVEAGTQLASLLATSVTGYLTVDDETSYRFGAAHHA